MKNMVKSLFAFLMVVMILVSNLVISFANETGNVSAQSTYFNSNSFTATSIDDSTEVDISDPRERAFIHLVGATTIVGKNGITINVGHAGMGTFDMLDSVKIEVKSDISDTKSKTIYNVSGITSQFFSFPLTKSMQNFDIIINIQEGTQTRRLTMEASYGFSESSLAAGGWNRGTFASRQASVDYHYNKHHGDRYVMVSNVEDYLNQASSFHYQVLNDTARGNLTNYTVVYGATNTKFTSKTSHRFALFTTSLNEIYSYGGN